MCAVVCMVTNSDAFDPEGSSPVNMVKYKIIAEQKYVNVYPILSAPVPGLVRSFYAPCHLESPRIRDLSVLVEIKLIYFSNLSLKVICVYFSPYSFRRFYE